MKLFANHSMLYRITGLVLCGVLIFGLCAATPALAAPASGAAPESGVTVEDPSADNPAAETPSNEAPIAEDPDGEASADVSDEGEPPALPAGEEPVADDPEGEDHADVPAESESPAESVDEAPAANDPAAEDPANTDDPAASTEDPAAQEPVTVAPLAPEPSVTESSEAPEIAGGRGYVAPMYKFAGINDYDYAAAGGISALEVLPSSFDYRSVEGGRMLTAVRNQGGYGTCWAFASLASASGSLAKQGLVSKAPELSPYHLTYSVYNSQAFAVPASAVNASRDPRQAGGNSWKATAVMSRWVSPVAESKFPYSLIGSGAISAGEINQADYHLTQTLALPTPLNYSGRLVTDNLNVIKSALMNYGPLSTAYCSDRSAFNQSTNAWYNNIAYNADHAVTIIGWNDNYPAGNFRSPGPAGNGAFLIQNSWGSWGSNGCFWLSYYDKTVSGIEHFSLSPANNYNHVYSYDDIGFGNTLSYRSLSTYAANVFQMPNDPGKPDINEKQVLSAVSLYLLDTGMSYEISAYRGMAAGASPVSGRQIDLNGAAPGMTVSGSRIYAGYYTIPLTMSGTFISPGERYSIVVKFSGSEGIVPVEYAYNAGDHCTINYGESYIAPLLTTPRWTDVKTVDGSVGNVCVNSLSHDAGTPIAMAVYGQKTQYYPGESFGSQGIAVISYSTGRTEEIPLSDIGVSGFDTSTMGLKTVTVQYGNFWFQYAINVIKAVKSLSVPQTTFYIVKGKSLTIPFVCELMPGSSARPPLKWTSSNRKNVSVSQAGRIKGLKVGKTAKITVTSLDGAKKTITVKVVKNVTKVTSVSVTKPPKTMRVGQTKILKAKIAPSKATGVAVTFSLDSKSKKIVRVDKAGKVTALKKGTAKITVKAGGKKRVISIKVNR